MNQFNDVSWEFANFLGPILILMIAVTTSAFLFYVCRGLVVWTSLKLRGYREREEVYLNGTRAVITKIGPMSTTFLILNGDGAIMRWASVSNVSMDSQKIERVSLKLKKLEELDDHDESV